MSELLQLGPFTSLLEAQLVRSRLGAAGIDAHLPGETSSVILGDSLAFGSGYRVIIAARDEQAARLALASGQSDDAEVGEPAAPLGDVRARGRVARERGSTRCPSCDGALVEPRRGFWARTLGGATLRFDCRICGHRWRAT